MKEEQSKYNKNTSPRYWTETNDTNTVNIHQWIKQQHTTKSPERNGRRIHKTQTENKSSMPRNTSTQRHQQPQTQENRIIPSSIGRTYYEEYKSILHKDIYKNLL